MLTIGQLAAYAGVTVRTVRHYHQRGLLAEPGRDHSGYRRYDAHAVVDLLRIRTLADAGVPLVRVRELMDAGGEEFDAAVADIDRRLRAEIRERQHHRERIRRLASGDSLALPLEAVAYLDRLRDLGFDERYVEAERDAWILVAAQLPGEMPTYMSLKEQQLQDPDNLAFYRGISDAVTWSPDDPRLPALADQLVALLEADLAADPDRRASREDLMSDELVALLDSMLIASVAMAPRFLELLRERGWSGWARLEPIDDRVIRAARAGPGRPARP